MTISKEERAELRMASEFADSSDRLDPQCALQLLDALDASDERIAELVALRDAHRDARERADARRLALIEEIASLQKRIAELEAAAQWRPIEEAPMAVHLLLTDGANVISGNKYRNYWNFANGADFTPTHFRLLPALPEGGAK